MSCKSADRSGMAALQGASTCHSLAAALCFASHSWQIALELRFEHQDFLRSVLSLLGKRRLCCGEKLANVRNRVRRRRFSVEPISICELSVTEGSS